MIFQKGISNDGNTIQKKNARKGEEEKDKNKLLQF